jgi:hypothetical protein
VTAVGDLISIPSTSSAIFVPTEKGIDRILAALEDATSLRHMGASSVQNSPRMRGELLLQVSNERAGKAWIGEQFRLKNS